jgi:hypothetical protein
VKEAVGFEKLSSCSDSSAPLPIQDVKEAELPLTIPLCPHMKGLLCRGGDLILYAHDAAIGRDEALIDLGRHGP